MDVLPITLTIAGAAALMNLWLSVRVSLLRRRHHVSIGDGGNERVATRMRAHANFAEYTPLFLILLGLVELARGTEPWLWIIAILFILGRLSHPFGMERPAPNALRIGGMLATYVSMLILAVYSLSIPYLDRASRDSVTYAGFSSSSFSLSGGTKLS